MKDNKKNKKIFEIFVCICILIILIYGVIHIYAIFYSEVTGNVTLENGTWNIIVNGTEISKGADVEFVIDTIQTDENDHVKPGTLAPGLSGNFEISINPTDTDVSVRYDVMLNQENLTNSNLEIKSVQEVQENNTLIKTAENTYTGVIPLEKIQAGGTNKIKVQIQWKEDGNDEEDTNLGQKEENKLQIPITVHVCQYLGETIQSYN